MISEYREISYKEAVDFLLPRHYSGRKPNIKYAFGVFVEGDLIGVCSFGKPASNSLCVGVCGKEYSSKVYELNRLCIDGELDKPLSHFVSFCLKSLKSHNLIIVSYADTQMDHVGYIYQACNFIYTGTTKGRTDKYVSGGKHSRHYDKASTNSIRKIRSPKYRYVFFCCRSKKEKKLLRTSLKYKEENYPKGLKGHYELGDYIKTLLVNEKGEEFYDR